MSTNSYRLYGAPNIISGESISSWLQRLSQQQGLSIDKLFSFVDANVPNDLDSAILEDELTNLVKICGLTSKDFQVIKAIGRSIRAEKLLQWQIRKRQDGRPVSAFCSACLNTDRIPYYRIEWRFQFWKYCPEHKLALLLSCSDCQREIVLDRAILLSSAPAPSLAYCRFCLSRHAEDSKSAVIENQNIEAKISVQRSIMASVLQGYCMVVPFENRFTLEMMFRLRELGLLLSAERSEFCDAFDPQRIRVMRKFIKWMQIRIDKKEPIFENLRSEVGSLIR